MVMRPTIHIDAAREEAAREDEWRSAAQTGRLAAPAIPDVPARAPAKAAPARSQATETRVTLDDVNARILRLIGEAARTSDHGRTVDELANLLNLDTRVVAPRVWKLEHEYKVITDTGFKRPTRLGGSARVLGPAVAQPSLGI